MADLTKTFHSFARLGAGIATVLLLILTPSAHAEVLEETTAATAEAVEAVTPTEAGSATSPALEAEAPATEVEEAAPEPTSVPVDVVKVVAEPVERTVGSVAAPIETTASRIAETEPLSSGAASGPVSKVVSAVSKTVESAPTGPMSSMVEAADKAVEDIGDPLKNASAPATPQLVEPAPAFSTGSLGAAEPNVVPPTAASPEPQGTHASLGVVASSPSTSPMRLIGGAAELLRAAPSDAPAPDSLRTATGGVGRGSEDPSRAPGPRPGSPATVGSAPGGTSFAPIVALLALLALAAPATFRRPLAVPSSRAPAELACALERPG